MKRKLTLTVDRIILDDFRSINSGSISRFLEEKMAEYVEAMRLKWWFYCSKCGEKVHIRVILNNNGICPKCQTRVAEQIKEL